MIFWIMCYQNISDLIMITYTLDYEGTYSHISFQFMIELGFQITNTSSYFVSSTDVTQYWLMVSQWF